MKWSDRVKTDLARDLRTNATDPERKLWQAIRNKQILGVRFNRQVRVGPYICDFTARNAGLVIELDGGLHADTTDADLTRTQFLASRGYHVIRFWNHDVMGNLEGVTAAIEATLETLPLQQGHGTLLNLPQAGGE